MSTQNRFDTDFGDDGFNDPRTGLHPFGGLMRFQDRTYAVTVWERNRQDAERYCLAHGLKLDGQIIQRIDSGTEDNE